MKNCSLFTLLFIVATVSMGGLLFGFDTAVISGATTALVSEYSLTPETKGLTVAIALVGTIIGALSTGWFGDRYGRRDCIKVLAVLFFISAVGCAFAWNWHVLLVSRFIGGLAIGGASVLVPTYISEISPARLRGRLVATFQMNVVAGILLAYLSNWLIGMLGLEMGVEWRVKLGVAAVPAVLLFTGLFFVPRSPRWLIKMGKKEEALKVLAQIGEENGVDTFNEIEASLKEAKVSAADSKLFQKKYFYPIMLAFFVGAFNQLAGINGLLYYLNDIFSLAGFDKGSGDFGAVCVGATNLVFTLLAMTVIDRFGRKFLLLVGSVGTAACLLGVAWIFYSNTSQSLLIWFLIGYIAFFALSQGAVIWVYISEVFPTAVRAKGQSLGSFTHWFFCALVSFLFPIFAEWSRTVPFVFFAAMMVLQFFVVLFIFPETKNVPLEEMQKKLKIK